MCMVNYKYQFTKEEVEPFVETLKKVMDFVRILNADQVNGKCQLEDCDCDHYCYNLLHKKEPCEKCISEEAFEKKSVSTKLEFIDDACYQFFSWYIEIDGAPKALEIAKKIDERDFVDSNGYRDLVEKYAAEETRIYRDPLTGIYNRAFYEEVEKNSTNPAGIAIIDLDDFKLCNDIYGHKAGDIALQTVTSIIQKNVRSNDKIIRFGGDEILLILDGIQEDSFDRKLERIRSQVHAAVVPGFGKMQLSISIGAVISTNQTRENSIIKADRLMYAAKSTKNKVVTAWNEYRNLLDIKKSSLEKKPLVMIVDDSEINRLMLNDILESEYRVIEAEDGKIAIEKMEKYKNELSIILLDIVMPNMDGFEVLDYMNSHNLIQDLPVIMISSMNEDNAIRRCYELGISDYIRRPFSADVVSKRVHNIVRLYQRQRKLQAEIREQIEEREKNSRIVTTIISHVVENRNGESGPHVIHVEQITEILLDKLTELTDIYSLTKEDKKLISLASALHDIGKIGIDEKILNKPRRLTDEEFNIMKSHTTLGAAMIRQVQLEEDDPMIQYAYEICRWHHEKWDGKGYPDGLKGNYIPISAQVVSIADVYDALVSDRVYKPAFTHEQAIQMILNGECGKFNPILLECLLLCQKDIQMAEHKSAHSNRGGGSLLRQ